MSKRFAVFAVLVLAAQLGLQLGFNASARAEHGVVLNAMSLGDSHASALLDMLIDAQASEIKQTYLKSQGISLTRTERPTEDTMGKGKEVKLTLKAPGQKNAVLECTDVFHENGARNPSGSKCDFSDVPWTVADGRGLSFNGKTALLLLELFKKVDFNIYRPTSQKPYVVEKRAPGEGGELLLRLVCHEQKHRMFPGGYQTFDACGAGNFSALIVP